MHVPSMFSFNDDEGKFAFMKKYSFATIVTNKSREELLIGARCGVPTRAIELLTSARTCHKPIGGRPCGCAFVFFYAN